MTLACPLFQHLNATFDDAMHQATLKNIDLLFGRVVSSDELLEERNSLRDKLQIMTSLPAGLFGLFGRADASTRGRSQPSRV